MFYIKQSQAAGGLFICVKKQYKLQKVSIENRSNKQNRFLVLVVFAQKLIMLL